MKQTIIKTMTGALAGICLSVASVNAAPLGTATGMQLSYDAGSMPIAQVQYYYHGRPHHPYYGGPGYYGRPAYGYGPRYYRHGYGGDVAAGVAAGAIGALALGGLAASGAFDPPAAPMAPGRRQWCADRYRSYDPANGTFIGRDGRVRFCG